MSIVTVTLRDASSTPVAGKTVTLSSSRGATDTISAASGPSNASGVVTFSVTSTTSGTSTYSAADVTDVVAVTQTASVAFTPGAVGAAQSTVAASLASVVANGSATSTVTVTLRDAHANAVPGRTVTLSSSRGATDAISAASGPSDASGVVTFDVSSTSAGSSTYTASADGGTLLQTASVGFTAGPVSADRSTTASSPASVVADGATTATITVTLRDSNDNPVPGKTVTLASSRGATDTISAASGSSDSSGVVTFTVTSTTSGSGGFTATDATDSVVVTQAAAVVFTAGSVANARSTVTTSAGTVNADGSATATITVTLRDANDNPVPGKTVTLASSRGATDTISAASGASSASGAVTFTVRSSVFGSSVLSATDQSDVLVLGATAAVTFRASLLVFTAQPSASSTAGVAFATQPVVALEDAAGNTDPAFQSNVTVSIGSNPGAGSLSGTAVATAVSGVATFSGLSVDKAGVGYTLIASDAADGLPSAASSAFTVVPGPPSKLAFTIQPSNAGAGIGPTFQVAVQDASGNLTPTTGYVVTVAIGTNPSAGVLTGTATAASRGGVATFTGLGVAAIGAGYTLVATDTPDGLAAATSAPFDVTAPTIVGSGTPASCTEAALNAALVVGRNITFSCGASPVTITFSSSKNMTVNTSLDGGGLVTLSGGGASSLFAVNGGVTMALANLTIAAGFTSGNGGAISSNGTLSITGCTLTGNSTSSSNDYYGSPANGGAVLNGGTLIVASSTFAGNTVTSNNDFYGASANGGAIHTGGTLLVTNSTFSGNSASASNSYYGTAGNGGAIFNAGGRVVISGSTFSGNSASASSSFFGTGGQGGALFGGGTLTNTIVANGPTGANCAGSFTNGGHDLDSDGSCGVGAATSAMLDPAGLASNGGPTRTIALQPGSPATNAGDQAICAAAPVIGVDQRGFARPGAGATSCSIGAFEFNAN